MVPVQRNVERKVKYRVEAAQVVRPQEMLLSQLYGGREEAEHRIQDRQLQEHRETSAHRADSGAPVKLHHRLLLFQGILLLRIFLVQLVHLRLDDSHLGGRNVRLDSERGYYKLYEYGKYQYDDTEIGDILAQEIERRDNDTAADEAYDRSAQRDYPLVMLVVVL